MMAEAEEEEKQNTQTQIKACEDPRSRRSNVFGTMAPSYPSSSCRNADWDIQCECVALAGIARQTQTRQKPNNKTSKKSKSRADKKKMGGCLSGRMRAE